MTMRNT